MLKQERNRIFNRDKEVFQRLAQHLIDLQQDDEPDEEAEFDEDETESIGNPNTGDIQNAVRAYLAALRTLARSRYRKRSVPKGSRAAKVIMWLGDALPSDRSCWKSANVSVSKMGCVVLLAHFGDM
ncbi:hypothetical protein LP419_21955 [Massilia sp. H-1]|nr:hypothetical protein LP419_21955 [Massilia sp. H-1]